MRLCSAKECNRIHYANGYCTIHNWRMKKHGTLKARYRAPAGEALAWLLNVAVKHKNKSECLIWPYGKTSSGYGYLRIEDKMQPVHRFVCEKTHGKPPTSRHEACHSCGKGHEACVNRHHLRWDTHKGNVSDRAAHGTDVAGERHGGAKLTDKKVRRILILIGKGWTNKRLAVKFNVSPSAIGHIRSGSTWKHIVREQRR